MPLNGKEIERRRGKRPLRECAIAAGWGAKGFARWYMLESGKGEEDPTLGTLETVARVLGCTVNDIITPPTASSPPPTTPKPSPPKPSKGRGSRTTA